MPTASSHREWGRGGGGAVALPPGPQQKTTPVEAGSTF